jgi:hypothetical protein
VAACQHGFLIAFKKHYVKYKRCVSHLDYLKASFYQAKCHKSIRIIYKYSFRKGNNIDWLLKRVLGIVTWWIHLLKSKRKPIESFKNLIKTQIKNNVALPWIYQVQWC